ncbi:TPA: glycosyltransferase, partial [Vibrio antiquarius]
KIKSDQVDFDFFISEVGGEYEHTVKENGCKIIQAPKIKNYFSYFKFLRKTLEKGKYEVVHVHGSEFLGDVMKVAYEVGVPVRVSHSHNTMFARGKSGLFMRLRHVRQNIYERYLISKFATHILGCSEDAGRFLMGKKWDSLDNTATLFCGVNTDNFSLGEGLSKNDLLDKYNIPSTNRVIGHVGSMGQTNQKNHFFILEVFEKFIQKSPDTTLFLAGDGPLREEIKAKAISLGIEDKVLMPGIVNEVDSLMLNVFDVFFLPSLWEGLPVAGLEAICSGLVTVCSTNVTKEFTDTFKERVIAVDLEKDLDIWVNKLLKASS